MCVDIIIIAILLWVWGGEGEGGRGGGREGGGEGREGGREGERDGGREECTFYSLIRVHLVCGCVASTLQNLLTVGHPCNPSKLFVWQTAQCIYNTINYY